MDSSYYYSLLIFFLGLGGFAFIVYFIYSLYKKAEIEKYATSPFPKKYEAVLQNIPLYQKLDAEEQEKIKHSILIFVNTKEFIGVALEITDEMRVVVAFHACVLLLHLEVSQCYENLSTIVIYPNTVIAQQVNNNGGVYTKGEFLLEGQSASGVVVLSWSDVKKDAYHLHRDNVTIHEFAHEIDFLDGEADGTPPLPSSKYHEWAQVLSQHFNRLQEVSLKNRDWGDYKLIGSYAATNEAEFFAVLTERYMETPQKLKKHFPDLYRELEDFYKLHKSIMLK